MVAVRKVSVELRYPGRTVEQVRAMLADPAFRDAVCAHQGVVEHAVRIDDRGNGAMTVEIERTYGADFVPSFARSFVGSSVRAVQRENWSATAATFDVAVPGKPAEVSGSISLVQQGTDAVESITAQAKVSIPLIGSKLEDLVVALIQSAFEAEHDVGLTWPAPDESGQRM
jgi:hypothetical protein